jgi:hypothetical protein
MENSDVGFAFDTSKGSEAAARFAELAGGAINVLKLSKLTYLLDRLAIERRGVPVMGGSYYSMKDGPMISEVLDLINRGRLHPKKPSLWESLLGRRKIHEVAVSGEIEERILSAEELGFIDELWRTHGDKNEWSLRDWCHQHCAEYTEVKSGRKEILLPQLVRAVNGSKEDAEWLENEAKAERALHSIFG